MRELIREAVKDCTNLTEVKQVMHGILKDLHDQGYDYVGYVSGMITSEGPQNIDKNVRRLESLTDYVRARCNFPVFSATDVIGDALFEKINGSQIGPLEWQQFWREVLDCNNMVTHMIMTPKWTMSTGAKDEHATAVKVGMHILYMSGEMLQ